MINIELLCMYTLGCTNCFNTIHHITTQPDFICNNEQYIPKITLFTLQNCTGRTITISQIAKSHTNYKSITSVKTPLVPAITKRLGHTRIAYKCSIWLEFYHPLKCIMFLPPSYRLSEMWILSNNFFYIVHIRT